MKPNDICLELKNVKTACWGYEHQSLNCTQNDLYLIPECDGDSKGWARNQVEQLKIFYEQADFGYVKERKKELKMICHPQNQHTNGFHSSLECTQYFRFCRAKNIIIDFEKLKSIEGVMKYNDDIIGKKQIGGWNCDLNSKLVKQQGDHRSPLQSWYAELENYHVFDYENEKPENKCDVWLNKPTFIMKLDATVNMYHHFCDFINLYASLHLNNSFNLDNFIVVWDTFPYRSNFGFTWNAFTINPILDLSRFKGKKVCIKDAVFPLLPRMIYGIYYNMPLIHGCAKTGLFRAFNQHLLDRLNIQRDQISDNKIRITLISRQTQFRKILNEDELLKALKRRSKDYLIERHDFNHWMSFKDQMQISANSDIFIGMHGAGLTHCLFQPDWGVLFELYNCEDTECYKDLARLRGVKYITWEDESKVFPQDKGQHPQLGAHAKFTNYKFDVDEFIRLVEIGVEHVKKTRKKCNLNTSFTKDEL